MKPLVPANLIAILAAMVMLASPGFAVFADEHEPHAAKQEEEVAALLERQQLLEADLASMQQKLKLLQEESGAIKLRLAQLKVASSVAASAPAMASPAADSAPAGEQLPAPAVASKPAQEPARNPFLRAALIATSAMLSALILWLGLHYYAREKLRAAVRQRQKTGAAPGAAARTLAPIIIKHPSQPRSGLAPAAAKAVPPPVFPASPQRAAGEKADADSLLEEATLYVASGRQAKAVEILQDLIRRYPAKAEAWTLLLSVYSSLGKAAAFESTAREFLEQHKASPAWSGIQALGRTLDRDNPLYAEHAGHAVGRAPDKHQPIGDVLIEMGVLSRRELQIYLDEFDPKRHGRFGGYLVAHKVISIAQLDHALQQQQGLHTEAQPAELPSLRDIEQFLAGYDPKRHGTVGEYMALHHAASAEQLGQLLQQQSAPGAAAAAGGAGGPASSGGRPAP